MQSATASGAAASVRLGLASDASAITRFLRRARFLHLHADWRPPIDWLTASAFTLREVRGRLTGCLAVAADPPPAAWVRVLALTETAPAAQLAALLRPHLSGLRAAGVTEIGILSGEPWLMEALLETGLAFACETWVDAYTKPDVAIPGGIELVPIDARAVQMADFAQLAALEGTAYAPLWRHSSQSLFAAWEQSLSFDVVWQDSQPVAFQYSTRGQAGAHLARITVGAPYQRQGIGTALLAHALRGYQAHGLSAVTLNTQRRNDLAQGLYRRFGFIGTGFAVPVWVARLPAA